MAVPRFGGIGHHPVETSAGRLAAASGPKADADHRQHHDGGPADTPRPGIAGGAVRRADAPPPRPGPLHRGHHAGARPGGAAGTGQRLLQPPGYRRHRLPNLRPLRPCVRARRRPRAPDAQALRHDAIQPPPSRDVARCARRVRRCAGPRRRQAERRGRGYRELVFSHTVGVIFRAAFSLSARDEEDEEEVLVDEFIGILRVFSRIMGEFHVGDFFPWLGWMGRRGFYRRLYSARSALDGFIDKIVDDHVRRGKNQADADADLVDGLLALLADSEANLPSGKDTLRFTGDNVKAMIMDMLFGGPETVRSKIEWAMAEMMHNPDTLLRLQRELADVVGLHRIVDDSDLDKLPFLGCVIKETFRMHPPIPMLLHEAVNDCVLGGYFVPRGSRMVINMWAINRDREAWKDSHVFRPSRFMEGEGEAVGRDLKGGSFDFLVFGSGRRSCPAQGLGLHAVKFAVAQLAHGFNWELPDGMKPTNLDMGDISSLTASRATRDYAVLTTRLTCPL